MTNDEDHKLLTQFSRWHGVAVRVVLSHKDDIARWMGEGWSVRAIHRLLKAKGLAVVSYQSFNKAINKVFHGVDKKKTVAVKQNAETKEHQQKNNNRPRPHEMQRKDAQKFVTMVGMDHIGLDKKDE